MSRQWSRPAIAVIATATPVALFLFYREHPPFTGHAAVLPASGVTPAEAGTHYLAGLIPALACLVLFVLGAAGWGRWIFSRMVAATNARHRFEQRLFEQGLGFALLGLVTFVAGEFSFLGRGVAWITILAGITLGVMRGEWRVVARHPPPLVPPAVNRTTWAALVAGGLFAVAMILFSLAPLTANDALVYHLNLPRLYIEQGSTAPVTWNVYSRMPGAMEFLYTLARALGPEATPRLLHAWLGILVLAAGWALARRSSKEAGLLALLLLAGTPLLGDPRTIGNIDFGITFFFTLALLAGLGEERHRRTLPLYLAAIFLGYLSSMRYTALALAALAVIIHLCFVRQSRKHDALVMSVTIAAFVVPWLVRGEVRNGNPVYPLARSLFGGVEWSTELGRRLLEWQWSMGMGRSFTDWLLLPWNVSIHGQFASEYRFFDGIIGPWYLLLVALAATGLLLRTARERVYLAIVAAGFLLWAAGPQQLRFAMPLLVPAATLGASALATLGWARVRRAGIALVMVTSLVECTALAVRATRETGPVLTGRESRAAYLQRHVQSYAAMTAANQMLPASAKLLLIWENRGYYLERAYLGDSFFEASMVMEVARECGDPEAFADRLHSLDVTHVLYNDLLGRYFAPRYGEREVAILSAFGERYLNPMGNAAGAGLFEVRPRP